MIFLLMLLWAAVHGATNAILYSRKGALAFSWNEHVLLVAERVVVVGLIVAGSHVGLNMILAIQIAAGVLAFSYVHNGTYYVTRDHIDDTNHGWEYDSPTDTAQIKLSYHVRLLLLIFSLILQVGFLLMYE